MQLILLFFFAILISGEDVCKVLDDNKVYDLGKLIKKDSDYKFEVKADKENEILAKTYYLNVCHGINNKKTDLADSSDVSAFFKLDDKKESFSIGKINKKPYSRNGNLVLEYTKGDLCPDSLIRRTTIINFICDKEAKEGIPSLVGEYNECTYIFNWRTSAACPSIKAKDEKPKEAKKEEKKEEESKKEKPKKEDEKDEENPKENDENKKEEEEESKPQKEESKEGTKNEPTEEKSGFSFSTFFTVVISVYLLGGILYNRLIKGAQGMEQLPHYKFWFEVFDFIKDMAVIIAVKVWDSFQALRNRTSNYSRVPRDSNALIDDDDEV